jgi:uncharacterized membrane protein YhaH (DUF805 family)
MGFGQAIAAGFTDYINFQARSTRSAYWYFVLFLVIGGFITGIADVLLFQPQYVGPINGIFSVATIIGRTGWWVLLALIPIIGWIVLIVWACQPTDPQTNAYGPPPTA